MWEVSQEILSDPSSHEVVLMDLLCALHCGFKDAVTAGELLFCNSLKYSCHYIIQFGPYSKV